MNLEEELRMVTNSVPIQQESTPVANTVATPVQITEEVKQEQMQSQAQVVQPTQTFIQPIPPTQQYVPPTPGINTINTAQTYDLSSEAGVKQVQFGQSINVNPISIVKLSVGEKMRFTILEQDVISLAFHYSEALGAGTTRGKRIPCWTTEGHVGKCCIDLGKPKARYYLPILVYPTMPNDPNTIIPNAKPQFKVLMTWDEITYNAIAQSVIDTNCNADFIATGKDTYGGIDVRMQATSYRNQFMNDISENIQNWRRCKSMLPSMVRENMTEEEYIRRLSQVNDIISNAPQNNYANYNNYNGIM